MGNLLVLQEERFSCLSSFVFLTPAPTRTRNLPQATSQTKCNSLSLALREKTEWKKEDPEQKLPS